MRHRFRLTLHTRRGEHFHSFVLFENLHPGKATRVLAEATDSLLAHETRHGSGHRATVRDFERGSTLRLDGGHCTFCLHLTPS